jgi:hypothetical protein
MGAYDDLGAVRDRAHRDLDAIALAIETVIGTDRDNAEALAGHVFRELEQMRRESLCLPVSQPGDPAQDDALGWAVLSLDPDRETAEAGPRDHTSKHISVDSQPVEAGRKFWSNDLRVVQIAEVAVYSNAYQDMAVQTWHRTTEGGGRRGGDFDTLDSGWHHIGRLVRWFEGKDAEDYAPGTSYADIKRAP